MKRELSSEFQIQPARRLLALFALSLLSAMLVACAGNTKLLPTTIAFAQGQMAPPSSTTTGSTVQFAAVVQNDSSNQGVSWLLTCSSPSNDCGSISRHTASGVPTTFVAPSSVPPGGIVTIQANSSALPSQGVTATISITPTIPGPVSISFSPAPPTTVTIDTAVSIGVVVANDHIGAGGKPMGFTISVSCAVAGTCGSVSKSAIGGTYFSPQSIPSGGTVTITATSVAASTQSVNATITITLPTVAISMVKPIPTSVAAGAAIDFGALVTDGTLNNASGTLGVDWTVICGSSVCGSFIPTHTANDTTGTSAQPVQKVTSYTAPTAVPPGGTVTITASATADPTKQVTTIVNVTEAALNNSLLKGQYAFLLNGVHVLGTSAIAGSIIANGNGNITGGEETLPGLLSAVTGITGSYYVGTDGRGLITLNGVPANTNGGWLNGQQVLAVTVIDSTLAVIEEFDGTGLYNVTAAQGTLPWYGSTLRGELELQQAASFTVPPSGPFAFAWQQAGLTISSPSCSAFLVCAAYYGGVLTADATGAVSSFSMDRYVDGVTKPITGGTYGFQSFGAADSFGHGKVSIGPYTFHYFLVDSGNIIVMASSGVDQTGLPTGHIYAQPAGPTLPAGNFVFTSAGSIPLNSGDGTKVVGSSPQTAGGWFANDTNGNVTGYLDVNDNGTMLSASVIGSVAPSAINGRSTLTLTGGGASKFAVYPTANHGFLMLQLDNGRSGIGTLLAQAVPLPAVEGNYAASLQQMGAINVARTAAQGLPVGAWADVSGQLVASSSSILSGTIDIDQVNGAFLGPSGSFWTQLPGQSATGNFVIESAGRATASIATTLPSTTQADTTQAATIPLIFYVVNGSMVLIMENDATPAVGILQVQNF